MEEKQTNKVLSVSICFTCNNFFSRPNVIAIKCHLHDYKFNNKNCDFGVKSPSFLYSLPRKIWHDVLIDGRSLLKCVRIHKRTWEDWGERNMRCVVHDGNWEEKKRSVPLGVTLGRLWKREVVHFKKGLGYATRRDHSSKSLTADVFYGCFCLGIGI